MWQQLCEQRHKALWIFFGSLMACASSRTTLQSSQTSFTKNSDSTLSRLSTWKACDQAPPSPLKVQRSPASIPIVSAPLIYVGLGPQELPRFPADAKVEKFEDWKTLKAEQKIKILEDLEAQSYDPATSPKPKYLVTKLYGNPATVKNRELGVFADVFRSTAEKLRSRNEHHLSLETAESGDWGFVGDWEMQLTLFMAPNGKVLGARMKLDRAGFDLREAMKKSEAQDPSAKVQERYKNWAEAKRAGIEKEDIRWSYHALYDENLIELK